MTGTAASSTAGRVAVVAGALALAWLAARGAVQQTLASIAPAASLAFTPPDGASLINLALARVMAAGGGVDAESRHLYRDGLARQPLSANGLSLAGLDASAAGDGRRARQLMEAAQRRDPRNVLPRIWLFDDYVRSRDLAAALDEVGPFYQLQSNARSAVDQVLTGMVTTADGRAALRTKLATNPSWRTHFFQTAVQNPTAQFGVLALLQSLPTNPDLVEARAEQSAVFGTLVSRDQGARAYAAWRQLLPVEFAARSVSVYDGSFAGWPGWPPFNWTLSNDANGTAERVRDPGMPGGTALSIRFFGSAAAPLANQLIRLAPGSHRLELVARRRSDEANGSHVAVTGTCQNNQLVSIALDDLDRQPRRLIADFTAPPACELMSLQVVGSPGESIGAATAEITAVAIDR